MSRLDLGITLNHPESVASGTKNADTGLAPRIRALAAEGLSRRKIVQRLSEEGVSVGYTTVQRILASDESMRREVYREKVSIDAQECVEMAIEAHREILRLGIPVLETASKELYYIDKNGDRRYSPAAVTAFANVSNAVQRAAATLGCMEAPSQPVSNTQVLVKVLNAYGTTVELAPPDSAH